MMFLVFIIGVLLAFFTANKIQELARNDEASFKGHNVNTVLFIVSLLMIVAALIHFSK